jgi:regulator of nucleoside diphosphate kinase
MSTSSRRKPPIVIGASDFQALERLAAAFAARLPDVADELQAELDRAKVVADRSVPASAVRMGSTVVFEADDRQRTVTLVYPAEADIAQGRISIMTPVGVALIGLSVGQSMEWTARDGKQHRFKVLRVSDGGAAFADTEPVVGLTMP